MEPICVPHPLGVAEAFEAHARSQRQSGHPRWGEMRTDREALPKPAAPAEPALAAQGKNG